MTTMSPPQPLGKQPVDRADLWVLRFIVLATATVVLVQLITGLANTALGKGFTFASLQQLEPTPLDQAAQLDGITGTVTHTINWHFEHPSLAQGLWFRAPEIHTAAFLLPIAWLTWRLVGELLREAPFTRRAGRITTWLSLLMGLWVVSHWAVVAVREMALSPAWDALGEWNISWQPSPTEWFLLLLALGSTLLVWSVKRASEHQHDIETLV